MSRVGIIGVGNVGALVAHVIMQKGLARELYLYDKNEAKAVSEMIDLRDAAAFFSTYTEVKVVTLDKIASCEVVISALGHIGAIDANADRFTEMKLNVPEIKAVAKELNKHDFFGKMLVITNPCDAMTDLYFRELDLAEYQVIGTGTLLDSARMMHYVGVELEVDPRCVSGYVIGEHGDSQFVAWSTVYVGGRSMIELARKYRIDLDEIEEKARKSGYLVHSGKGYTNVAIAEATVKILEALLKDSKSVLPVSSYNKEHDCFISLPVIVDCEGVEDGFELSLTYEENKKLLKSINEIKEKSQLFG